MTQEAKYQRQMAGQDDVAKKKNTHGEEESNENIRKGGGRDKASHVTDLQENAFEELNAAVDTIVSFPGLRVKSQYVQEIAYHLQELIIQGRLARSSQAIQLLLYLLEELPALFHIFRSPKLLINVGSAQSLRPRLFEPVLLVPNPSLCLHRMTKVVRVIDCV